MQRIKLTISGQVQGVGFRPFVYRVAHKYPLTGFVQNTPFGVVIEVQASYEVIENFRHELRTTLPPLARVTTALAENVPVKSGETGFEIHSSSSGPNTSPTASRDTPLNTLVSPDAATCADCLADLREPNGHRQAYPFTNCTNCGPRYTIISALPYDRPFTSMGCFPMCPSCNKEYENPLDRRFHAQPNACPVCGPEVWLTDKNNQELARGDKAMRMLAQKLAAGEIAAIKGLGGFHLACNALDEKAVASLRKRKHRPSKPLALMVSNLETAKSMVKLNPNEETLLCSTAAPIVLAAKHCKSPLPKNIAPNVDSVGIMLPYTPLHHVLLSYFSQAMQMQEATNNTSKPLNSLGVNAASKQINEATQTGEANQISYACGAALVMTSGNKTDEPISIGNREALAALHDLADVFLLHNRDILIRADDSVVRVDEAGKTHFLRRARGYAPMPIEVQWGLKKEKNKAAPISNLATSSATSSAANLATNLATSSAANSISASLPAHSAPPKKQIKLDARKTSPNCIMGVGAELKNTICYARPSANLHLNLNPNAGLPLSKNPSHLLGAVSAFVSQHIGDVTDPASEQYMRQLSNHLSGLLGLFPKLIVRDLHPDYLSTLFAEELGEGLDIPVLSLQHHFAHAFSVLFENNHQGEALVLAMDGSGFSADNSIWGGELIRACTHSGSALRIGHITHTLTPGGDSAAREPWRMAQAYMFELGHANAWFKEEFSEESQMLSQILPLKLNCPINTSCGRLFDAVAGILGFGSSFLNAQKQNNLISGPAMSYEGQAAMWLEAIQDKNETKAYPCKLLPSSHALVLNTLELFDAVYNDVNKKTPISIISRRFHLGLIEGLTKLAEAGAQSSGLTHIGLSGGVFNNATLSTLLPQSLHKQKLIPLQHQCLPPGDACISFGQAMWGLLQERTL